MNSLSRLFKWRKKVNIIDKDKILAIVYMRLVGDDDYRNARDRALKASKILRVKLRDSNSEEYISAFVDIDTLSVDDLVLGVLFSEWPDFRDEASLLIPEEKIAELPDNPTLEQQEEYNTKIEEKGKKRTDAITKYMTKKSDEKKDALLKTDIEELKKLYRQGTISLRCTEEFTNTFREWCVFKVTYSDDQYKIPAFDSFEDFTSSSPQLKRQLMSAYLDLEISGEELKN